MDSRMSGNGEVTPPYGTPARELLKRHDSDIEGLKGAVKTVADEVHELRSEVAQVSGVVLRVEAGMKRLTIPPPRGELPSGLDLRAFAEAVKAAAIEGERRPDTTPDAQVDKVLEDRLERVDLLRKGKLFNKLLWLAVAGAASIGADRIILFLTHR